MSAFGMRDHGTVNGYQIRSYYDSRWGGRKFFVQWMDGEYLTQEAAEAAAREGNLRDIGDSERGADA